MRVPNCAYVGRVAYRAAWAVRTPQLNVNFRRL